MGREMTRTSVATNINAGCRGVHTSGAIGMSQSSFVEPLEQRQLLAASGPVVSQQFIGTPEGITAVVLHFDVPLDPTTGQNPLAYALIKKFRSSGSDGF